MSPEVAALVEQLRMLALRDPTAWDVVSRIDDEVSSGMVGLYDAKLTGWYDDAAGELYAGLDISADDVVLDVGCGDGGALTFCARRGAHVILADVDAERVARARALIETQGPRAIESYVTDANPLPLADGTATRVVCTEVMEHVDDPAAFIAELVRVGAPGARYLLTVPDVLQERMQTYVAKPRYFQKPNHIRIFEREEFDALVRDSGLIIERKGYYGFFWSIWWLLFWACDVDFSTQVRHPVLDNWARSWRALLETPEGPRIRSVLDRLMPKSQVIVARKPRAGGAD